jgi:hypothetical protein
MVVLGSTSTADPSNRPRADSHGIRHASPAALVAKPTTAVPSGAVAGAPIASLTTDGVKSGAPASQATTRVEAGTGEKKKSRFTVKSTLKEVFLFYAFYFVPSSQGLIYVLYAGPRGAERRREEGVCSCIRELASDDGTERIFNCFRYSLSNAYLLTSSIGSTTRDGETSTIGRC